jgi:hypothetical protein
MGEMKILNYQISPSIHPVVKFIVFNLQKPGQISVKPRHGKCLNLNFEVKCQGFFPQF